MSTSPIPLIAARFSDARAMHAAARRLRASGYEDLDTHGPYPTHGGADALGLPRSPMSAHAGMGGLLGAVAGYLIQWIPNAVIWPLDAGGRPANAPLAFVPVTFECGILGAALFLFAGLLLRFRFPLPWHPVFEIAGFESATSAGWWISVPMRDPDRERPVLERRFLALGARQVATAAVEAP